MRKCLPLGPKSLVKLKYQFGRFQYCRAKILAPWSSSCQDASNDILFCLGKDKFHVDLRSRSGHRCPGQYLDLEWSCCISLDWAAHSEHIGAFADALAQFGQEFLTKN